MIHRLLTTGLLAAALSLPTQSDLSLRVEHVETPAHPVNTVAPGVVIAEVEIQRISDKAHTRVLYGQPGFVMPALEALERWRFALPATDIGRTSVTFLFRPHNIYPVNINAAATWPWNLDEDFPPLPQRFVDPGYPATSLATGSVILQVQVDASGIVVGTKVIEGVRPLTDKAQQAVMKWKFSPARIDGKPAPGTAFVVISFVLPT